MDMPNIGRNGACAAPAGAPLRTFWSWLAGNVANGHHRMPVEHGNVTKTPAQNGQQHSLEAREQHEDSAQDKLGRVPDVDGTPNTNGTTYQCGASQNKQKK